MHLERRPQVMSSPCSRACNTVPLHFFLFWCCGCYSPCLLTQGMLSVDGAQSDPKHRLIVVEYERSCRAPTAARLHHSPPGCLPILALRPPFCVIKQGCLRSTRAHRGPKCPSSDRIRNAPSTQALRLVPRAGRCLCTTDPLPYSSYFGRAVAVLCVHKDS